MKTHKILRTMLFAAAACLGVIASAHADVRVESISHDSNINLVGDDVVITAHDSSEARITPAGDLTIRGKQVSVNDDQRKLLKLYALGIHDIQKRGLAIGQHAVSMVSGMLGELVAAALSDSDEQEIDQRVRARAEPLKDEARALCKDVQAERRVQDQISTQLPAFQPYAVIDTDSEHDCHIDDKEV